MKPVEDSLCCWRNCLKPAIGDEAPLCLHHLIDAWALVQNAHRNRTGEFVNPVEAFLGWRKPDYFRAPPTFVYYARLRTGDIKIGYSTNVRQRMTQLRVIPGSLLALEPGDEQLEKMRHAQFARTRDGRTESFAESPDLLSHIAMIRGHFGEPADMLTVAG